MKLRDAIQKQAVQMPAYGYRRITAALQHAGWEVNRKRVLRLMRVDNLLCLRKRAFVRTTDSNHELRIYPNLARELKPSGLNQLWVADITYIRLLLEFVYLAVILDAFSRRVIGWALGRTLEAKLALAALQMAIGRGRVVPGLVHRSDRGVQYASKDYVKLLTAHGILISMSRRGSPYDNAQAESFMKTLKYERKFIAPSILTLLMRSAALASSLKVSITRNGCPPRWAICRQLSSSDNNCCCRQSSWWARHEGS